MKLLWILPTLFVFACGTTAPPASQSTPPPKKEVSDEELINSLLGAEVSTDPMAQPPRMEEPDDTDDGEMVFE